MSGAVGMFVHGVYVVGTSDGERINGMTAAWVSQVSMTPLMVVVSIAPRRFTYEMLKKTKKFSLSQLAEDQMDISNLFGGISGRMKDKFSEVKYRLIDGLPVLDDCIGYVICEVAGELVCGDHIVVCGRVVKEGIISPERKPLIFRWADYF